METMGRRRSGFTLIELLVVIAIIGVLAAILWPVMSHVQEKARQTQCTAHMLQINTALKAYKTDYGRYPLAPWYDGVQYEGGASALYPDYITSTSALRCPDDRTWRGPNCPSNYSSYNGRIAATGASTAATYWAFDTLKDTEEANPNLDHRAVTYNFYGFTNSGWEDSYWDGTTNSWQPTRGAGTAAPAWLTVQGLKARHDPRCMNPRVPDNAVSFHCIHHRKFYGATDSTKWHDLYVRVGGETGTAIMSQWTRPEFSGPPVATEWKVQK